jgi:thymidylate synthase
MDDRPRSNTGRALRSILEDNGKQRAARIGRGRRERFECQFRARSLGAGQVRHALYVLKRFPTRRRRRMSIWVVAEDDPHESPYCSIQDEVATEFQGCDNDLMRSG